MNLNYISSINIPQPISSYVVQTSALLFSVISIMDHIWHTEGLDLRMTPYTCLATGNQVGMIEVVRNAKTVYQIQRKAGKLAAIQVDSTQLYKWIREHNKTNLSQAIDTFTLSCAGYCVATFILGIGDRHPDNMMVSPQKLENCD